MKYSHDYSKLKKDKYTTIRRYKKGEIGDIQKEEYPSGNHYAIITSIKKMPLDDLPIRFLTEDTDLLYREDIYNLFQSFYPSPIDFEKEKFYIYFLKRVNKNENFKSGKWFK